MSIPILFNNFSSGEMSPLLRARVDLPKFKSGCKRMENVIPRMWGGAFSRPGMVFHGEVGDSTKPARLMPFDYSTDTRFVFEFQPGLTRFWSNGQLVTLNLSATNDWSSSATPYKAGQWVWPASYGSNLLYYANANNTPSSGNHPPSSVWTHTYSIKRWDVGETYSAGEVVSYGGAGGSMYVVTQAHTTPSDYSINPQDTIVDGVARSAYYRQLSPMEWQTFGTYKIGDLVGGSASGKFRVYRCKADHSASSSTRPPLKTGLWFPSIGSVSTGGTNYATVWEEVTATPAHTTASKKYVCGDMVVSGGVVYVAYQDHTSSFSNAPGAGGSLWSQAYAVPFLSASHTYAVGTMLAMGGAFYTLTTAVTVATGFDDALVAPATKPLEPSSFSSWSATVITYNVGDIVAYSLSLYQCFKQHVSSSSTAPDSTAGKKLWSKLANINPWQTPYAYTVGTFAELSGVTYKCVVAHTSSADFNTDLTAGKWVTASYPLTVENPWSADQLFSVQECCVNDWVYFTHPDVAVQKMVRYADTIWTMSEVDWDFPSMKDENITDTTAAVSTTTEGDTGTLTFSAPLLNDSYNGAVFAISHFRDDALKNLAFTTGGGSSTGLKITGGWTLDSYGTWNGNLYLENSTDNGTTWDVARSYTSQSDHNVTDTGNDNTTKLWRVRYVNSTGTPSSAHAVLRPADAKISGLVKVTFVSTSTVANILVLRAPAKTTATKYWSEQAWTKANGFPRAVTLHEQRLWFGGNAKQPRMMWASKIGDFQNFERTTLDDASLAYAIAGKANSVQWLASRTQLLIGTKGDESILGGSAQADTAITPTNVRAQIQSDYGSAYLPAVPVNDVILFVEPDGRTVREFVYAFEKNGYVAQRMTLLAEHVTRSGIKQISLQLKPDIIMWCVTNDGRLIGMTYERALEVVAWHQHPTTGTVESVACVGGNPGSSDEVWIVVKRTINGTDRRFVERLDPLHWYKLETANTPYLVNLDCAKVIETTGTLSGLDHLEGQAVTVVLDGTTVETGTISGGSYTPTAAHSVAVVGLPFTPYVEPNDIEVQMQDGESFGRYMRIPRLQCEMWNTGDGGQIRHDGSADWSDVPRVTDPDDSPPALFTGRTTDIPLDGSHARTMRLAFRQSKPFTFNLLALVAKAEINGD